jgi:hypothetical protein
MSRFFKFTASAASFAGLVLGTFISAASASPSSFGEQASTRALTEVDVELVLAVDVSFSMDDEEQAVQRKGYIDAIRSPEFIDAVRQGMIGRVALTYIEWGGAEFQSNIVGWRLIEDEASAKDFADKLAAQPLQKLPRTSISSAILHAGSMLRANPYRGLRNVIDISGDGPNNAGMPVLSAREWAEREGIVINGLPLMMKVDLDGAGVDMAEYYRQCVITGPGAFVIPVRSTAEFGTAIRTKIIREIAAYQSFDPVIEKVNKKQTDIDCGMDEAKLSRLRP